MARRVQVTVPTEGPGLRPTAAPVDTFVQTRGGDAADRLAKALSGLSPAVGRLSDQIAEKEAKEAQAQGAMDARQLSESQKSYKQAIAEGSIGANDSPWYQYGMKHEFGRLAADKYSSDLYYAMRQDPTVSRSTRMEDFDKFEADFRKKWLGENVSTGRDGVFESAFGPLADSYLKNARLDFAEGAAKRAVDGGLDLHFTRTVNTLATEIGRGVPLEMIAGEINMNARAWVLNGGDGTAINQTTVRAVISYAEEHGDPLIARKLLDMLPGGPGGSKLGLTEFARKELYESEQRISSDNAQRDERQRQKEAEDRQKAVTSVFVAATQALDNAGTNVHSLNLGKYRDALRAAGAPDQVATLYQMQEAYSDRLFSDEPMAQTRAFVQVHGLDSSRPGYFLTGEDAARLLGTRQISVATFRSLMAEIQARDADGGGSGASEFNDKGLKRAQSTMQNMFVATGAFFNTPDMRWRARNADLSITHDYLVWRKDHKDATADEINTWITANTEATFREFAAQEDLNKFQQIAKPKTGAGGVAETGPAVDPTVITRLGQELNEVTSGRRNSMSDFTLGLLKQLGVSPDAESIQKFIAEQQAIIRKVTPPRIQRDTTSQ